MTYEEAVETTEELRARFDNSFDNSDKGVIARLYEEVLGKELRPTTCQQCYHDALIEIYLYLKNNKAMKKKCNYRLRAGFIIACPDFHNGKIFTNDNLTDDVAREYLQKYPKQETYFQTIPEVADESTEDSDKEKQPSKGKEAKQGEE